MGSTTYSIRPDARPCFTWDSSPQDRCCMASEAECASHSVSTGKTLVSWDPLFHSPLSDTWLKWTLILLLKTVFFTQKRLVYVDNFMGTVHTEGQGRHFGYHLESWLEGNRDIPAMHAWNPNNLHLWGWTQKQFFAGPVRFSAFPLSLSLSVWFSLSPSLSLSLSCFPNGSDSSWFFYSQSCWWSIKITVILGKTFAAQGGVRPCFYAEIPAKAPATGRATHHLKQHQHQQQFNIV